MKGWLLPILVLCLLLAGCGESPTGQVYRELGDVPGGFSPPWNVFDDEYFLNVTVGEGTIPHANVKVNIVAEHPDMYFYNTIYVYQNISGVESWKDYTVDQAGDENWTKKKITWSAYLVTERLSAENWVLVYACYNNSGKWKCGCASTIDTVCDRWSIQQFPRKPIGECVELSPNHVCRDVGVGTPFCIDDHNDSVFTCVEGDEYDEFCMNLENTSCASDEICVAGTCQEELCNPRDTVACYTGNHSTRDVGECSDGEVECDGFGEWGDTCVGEVLPRAEDATTCLNNLDDDCDGKNDANDPDCAGLTYTCTDSDGGKNYTVRGNTTGEVGGGPYTNKDSCQDEDTLEEQYCDGSDRPQVKVYTCPKDCRNQWVSGLGAVGACTDSVCGNGLVESWPDERCELGDLNFTVDNGTADKTIHLTKNNATNYTGSLSLSGVAGISVELDLTVPQATFRKGSTTAVVVLEYDPDTSSPIVQTYYNGTVTADESGLGLPAGSTVEFYGPLLGNTRTNCSHWEKTGVLSCTEGTDLTGCKWDDSDCE